MFIVAPNKASKLRIIGPWWMESTGLKWFPSKRPWIWKLCPCCPHKGQRRGALMFSLICAGINGWVNNRKAGDLIRHRVHYDVTVLPWDDLIISHKMVSFFVCFFCWHYGSFLVGFVQFIFLMPKLWSFASLQTTSSWWRHQMETFSALLAICAGNSPVPGEFPAQRPVTRSFDVFFDLHLK